MGTKRRRGEFVNPAPAKRSAFALAQEARDREANASASSSNSPASGSSPSSSGKPYEDELLYAPGHPLRAYSPVSDSDTNVENQAAPAPPVLLSTWKPSPNNVQNVENGIVLSLVLGDTLTMVGQYGLQVKEGTINIYGATLESSDILHIVSASTIHALPFIACASKVARIYIKTCSRAVCELRKLSPLFGHIWNHGAFKLDMTDIGTPHDSFSFMPSSASDPLKRTLSPLDESSEQFDLIQTLCNRKNGRVPTVLVCGAKSTGKSTFARFLTNRLVTERLSPLLGPASFQTTFLLDLDPGQPEFSPPGHVSLIQISKPILGPSFTHSNINSISTFRIIRAHALAALSSKMDPIHFSEAADQLMCEYQKTVELYPGAPLVINCPGWDIGSGLDTLLHFIRKWSPSDVVYLQYETRKKTRSLLRQAVVSNFLHVISMPRFKFAARTPAELRAMQAMSYFHSSGVDSDGNMEWNVAPISSMRPWVVRYDEEAPGLRGIMLYGETIPPENLGAILEGCIVSIVVVEDEAAFSKLPPPRFSETSVDDGMDIDMHLEASLNGEPICQSLPSPTGSSWPQVIRTPHESLPYLLTSDDGYTTPLDPRKSFTIGQAIVRGIDVAHHTLHLITPVADATIQSLQNGLRPSKSNIVLVCGRLDPLGWAYAEDVVLAAHERSKRAKTYKTMDQAGGLPSSDSSTGRQEIIAGMTDEHYEDYEDHDLEIPYVHFERPKTQGVPNVKKSKKNKSSKRRKKN